MGESDNKSSHPGGGHHKKKWSHNNKKKQFVDKQTARPNKFLGGKDDKSVLQTSIACSTLQAEYAALSLSLKTLLPIKSR
jgi:hypothetical protein